MTQERLGLARVAANDTSSVKSVAATGQRNREAQTVDCWSLEQVADVMGSLGMLAFLTSSAWNFEAFVSVEDASAASAEAVKADSGLA
jgi:hypothetical protein